MTGPLLDPFILGFISGSFLSGCVFGALGCALGYDAGVRHVMRLIEADRTKQLALKRGRATP